MKVRGPSSVHKQQFYSGAPCIDDRRLRLKLNLKSHAFNTLTIRVTRPEPKRQNNAIMLFLGWSRVGDKQLITTQVLQANEYTRNVLVGS